MFGPFERGVRRQAILLATILLTLLALGCSSTGKPALRTHARGPDPSTIRFANVLERAGIDFEHYGERHRWCEIGPEVRGVATNEEITLDLFDDPFEFAQKHLIRMNGSGAAWIDYDADGDWDLYLVNGAGGPNVTNALYTNNGDGTFTVEGAKCGALDVGEGMGVSVADYDNDGYSDLFVTNFGGFVLYHNRGDGTFEDVTASAFGKSVKDFWYGGSAWGDYDGDGNLDLYVCGYVDLSKRPHNTDLRFPMDFEGFPNTLFRNNGDGTFSDATEKAGVGDAYRKSMQVLFADFNNDGRCDIFVANDTDASSMFLNRGDGTFKEFSGPSGTSSTDGSMGIAYGDYDRDGKSDLYISNYTGEADLLLRLIDNESSNDGVVTNAIYEGDFRSTGLLQRTWGKVGWGTGLFDFDNDGDLDLFVAGGHLNAVSGDNRDENLLFENDGQGIFTDCSKSAGILKSGKRIHRAAIFADYNDDGKVDIYVVNNGEKSYDAKEDRTGVLLVNRSNNGHHWLKIRLEGTKSNRDGFGAKVKVHAGDTVQVAELVSGSGYFSANAQELYFGLGRTDRIDRIEIQWPSGTRQTFSHLGVDQTLIIVEDEPSYRAVAASKR